MEQIHDFDNTVVAVLDDAHAADEVREALVATDYDFELLEGEEGKEYLDLAGGSGPAATIKRLMNAFVDQYGVMERFHRELDAGKVVVSVDSKPDDATEAVRILQDHDAEFIWKLGAWTYTQIED